MKPMQLVSVFVVKQITCKLEMRHSIVGHQSNTVSSISNNRSIDDFSSLTDSLQVSIADVSK